MESIIKKLGKTSVTVEKYYHSSEKEYNKLTIVEEEGTFKTYLSRKPVPIGIELTNREYWIPFSGVLESITFDYIKFKKDYASGKAIEDNAIIARHILDRNIERIKIALKAISEEEIDDNAIIERTIKDRNITSNKIAKENILTEHLTKKSIITDILADYAITAIKLADNSVTTRSIINENVTQEKLSIDLQFLISNLSKTATFAGIATPTTNPEIPTAKTFYIATDKGIYNNFNGIEVTEDEIVILYFDTTWHKKTTGIAQKETLIELKEKVDSLALGAFYGFFPNSSSLPIDITTSGYAYVGLDTPYKIWNFNGESWSDSGTSIDMNDADEEDITRNIDGKLQFKDKEYGDGMGHVILRKNKSFAEQVIKENTIYEIRYDFDLNGEEITIPKNCVLNFQGGCLNNGTLKGNNTLIKTKSDNIFNLNINLIGTFENVNFYPEWFGFQDDAALSINKITHNSTLYNKRCFLRNKEYIVKSTIYLYSRISLVGLTSYNSTIIKSESNDPILEILENQGYDFTIEYIRFDKNYRDGNIINFNVEVGKFIINECRFLHVNENYNAIFSDFNKYANGLNYFKLHKCGFACIGNCLNILKGGDGVSITECAFQSTKGYALKWIGVVGTANLKIDHNSFTGGGYYISINGCQQVLFSNNQCEVRDALLDDNKYAIKIGEIADSTVAPMDNVLIVNNNMNNVNGSAKSFIYLNWVIGGIIISNGFANVEYAISGGEHYSNISYINSRRNSNSDINKIYDPKDLIRIYDTGNRIFDLKTSCIKLKDSGANNKIDKAFQYYNGYYCIYNKETNTYTDLNNESLIKSGTTLGRPTKNLQLGFKYYDTDIKKIIFWNGIKWIDSLGFSSAKSFGSSEERPTAYIAKTGEGQLKSSDFMFPYYDTTLKTIIYALSINNNTGEVVWGTTPKGSTLPSNLTLNDRGYIFFDTLNNQLLCWSGSFWIALIGENINYKKSGLYSEKPINCKIGYAYFCTNRQTSEGSTDGIMIYHKGNNIWVDALGRIVE